MNQAFLNTIKKIHFIGIGGIGVSAVARLFLGRGVIVSGSDRDHSLITEKLAEKGATIFIGHDSKHISENCDLLVYSPAVPENNPELMSARGKGIKTYSYPEALGVISKDMRTIAVSGTHGKTTTTAMIAEVLISAQKSPTVIVGSLLKGSGSNFVAGESDLFVVEACEYKRSFLNLSPEILVITNIDNDHLDYYKDIDDIISAFHTLAMKVPEFGFVVADLNDENIKKALDGIKAKIIDYSLKSSTPKLILAVPGEHNMRNAFAALAVAQVLGVDESVARSALAGFQGTWRRMERKGEMPKGVIVYDDYAHHPTEIRATLQGFRSKFGSARTRVVFQPHLYSRTKLLLNEFAESFTDADEVIVAPIYAAREAPDLEISAEILAQAIVNFTRQGFGKSSNGLPWMGVRAMSDFSAIGTYLKDTTEKGDIIITMGAGDVHKIGEALLK